MGQITRHEYKTQDEWLKLRSSLADRLGGSELGIVAGHSQYTSPYTMFCEKVGLIQPKDISQKEAIIQGHDLEDYVAQRFTRKTGKKVHQELCIFTNSDAPNLKASIDRKLDDEDSGLECKTCRDMVMRKFPKGDFPQGYYDQCACYLKVTGLKRWYLAMLVFGTDFKVFLMTTVKDEFDRYAYLKDKLDKEIPLTEDEVKEWDSNFDYLEACYYIDQSELDACQFLAKQFIDRVKDYISGNFNAWPPEEIDGSDSTMKTILGLKPAYKPESCVKFAAGEKHGQDLVSGEFLPEMEAEHILPYVEQRFETAKVLKELKDELKRLDGILMEKMKDKECFLFPTYKVTCKPSTPRKIASVEKVEAYFAKRHETVPEGLVYYTESNYGIKVSAYSEKAKKKREKANK